MPLKFQWDERVDGLVEWSEETLQEAVRRMKAEEIGKMAIQKYYGASASTVWCFCANKRKTTGQAFQRLIVVGYAPKTASVV
jgi:hypothetical protein